MHVLFVRHAAAVEVDEWPDDDLSRPLTRKGRRSARAAFRFLSQRGVRPDRIISSEAVRSRETAALLATATKRRVTVDAALNPGLSPAALRKVLRKHAKAEVVALVGHEPDFSTAIAGLIGDGTARIKVAKAACALVALDAAGRGTLLWLLPPPDRLV